MVQYIITPWRNRQELLECRSALYPSSQTPTARRQQKEAVDRVSAWVQRGNCPHLIESTALLISAVIIDVPETPTYAVRAAYASAFARCVVMLASSKYHSRDANALRFVTGLADSQQEASYKLSMYQVARQINLPASLVELRHQCTHEELPSLMKLRAGSKRALDWIWENYWSTLRSDVLSAPKEEKPEDCRKVLQDYLRWKARNVQDEKKKQDFAMRIKKFDQALMLDTLFEMGASDDVRVALQSTKLAAALVSGEEFGELETAERKSNKVLSLEEIKAEMARTNAELKAADNSQASIDETQAGEEDTKMADNHSSAEEESEDHDEEESSGWSTWKGPWIPKPIGVV